MATIRFAIVLFLISISSLVSDTHGQTPPLTFKVKGATLLNPRVITGKRGSLEIQCLQKGLVAANLRDNLEIVSEENSITCTQATASDSCRWVSGASELESYLAINPTMPGNYTCRCQAAKPCTPDLRPTSAVVYLTDTSRVTVTAADGSSYVDIPNMLATNKTNFTLSCNMSNMGMTLETIAWFRNGKALSNDTHHNMNGTDLTVNIVLKNQNDSNRYSGMYSCEVGGVQDGPLRAIYEVRGAPIIRNSAVSQNKVEGDRVSITCDFDGQPPPDIVWTREGNKSLPEGRYKTGYIGVTTAVLDIENLIPSDYGNYICKANTDGPEAKTLLRIRSKLAPLWPFLGIVAELVILAAIIIIHEKRCAKKDEDEENDDGGDRKRSPTGSNEDNGVRQRKS